VRLPSPIAAAIVFIEAGAVLILEILSVRLLAPYVGLTLETTTSIIGAVLLGIAVGAGIGGWVADRTDPARLIVFLLVVGGLLALLTVPIVRYLGPTAIEGGTFGALRVTFAALVPVAAILSAISPAVAHWQLRDLSASGTVVGGLSAWATAGALVGTFGTGFVLIPLLPVNLTVLLVGTALVVTGVTLSIFTHSFRAVTVIGIILAAALLGASGALVLSPCEAETDYHCVTVKSGKANADRYLFLDTEANSFVDLRNPKDLGTFKYAKWVAEGVDNYWQAQVPIRAVFVGGGAFTLPRWLEATRPRSHSTVLEVDDQLITFDKEHLDLHTDGHLRTVTGDARLTMRNESTGSADLIVGDAFSGLTVPWQLMTVEWLREVRRVLKPDGFYAINMIDYHPYSLLRSEIATLRLVFNQVNMVTKIGRGNAVLFASNDLLPRLRHPASGGRFYAAIGAGGARPLTDNYAPVDQLQTR